MKPLNALLLSVLLLGAPSWSSGQSSPQLPGKRDYSDPNVELPRVPDASKRGPIDPNIRNIRTITIKWKRTTRAPEAQSPTADELNRLRQAAGIKFESFRNHGWGVVFQLPQPMSLIEAEEMAARIRALPDIEYAEPDRPVFPQAIPNDPFFEPSQWNLKPSVGGIDAQGAWDLLGPGDRTTVVAVIDTGVVFGHEDLVGRFVTGTPAGFDFVSDPTIANDGDGRDPNAADPGDWVSSTEAGTGVFASCLPRDSSWHGTFVSGIIGAIANNAKGIAGIGWNAQMLPARVFGKGAFCGTSSLADVRDAITWSAGNPLFTGEPNNPNPARVINMSLGSAGSCPSATQTVINDAYRRRAVLIAGAGNNGNSGGAVDAPANCNRVIGVAAVTRQGALASNSSFGPQVGISAPGGDREFNDPLDEIVSTWDGGTTVPLNDNAYGTTIGTSLAAPHVSGVVSLMLSVQPKLRAESVKTILQNTARPFPTGTIRDCTTSTCGAGIVHATSAVSAAKSVESGGVFHSIAVLPDGTVTAWGFNGNGQLGGGEPFGVVRAAPGTPIPALPHIRDAAAGGFHNVVARRDGIVMTWGYNGFGQLGNGTNTDSGVPVPVAGLTDVIAVAAGQHHTLALKADGTVFAWGYNFFGQLGPGPFDFTDRWTPVQVSGLADIVAIAAGGKRSLALRRDGVVFAWGDVSNVSPDGQTASVSSVPIQVQGLADVVGIAAGGEAETGIQVDVSMALTWDGKLYTWGWNSFGQLGYGNTSNSFVPQHVSALTAPVVSFGTGGWHSLSLLENGTLWAWGYNGEGEVGDGTTEHRLSPVMVSGALPKAIELIAGNGHSIAFLGDFRLFTWGLNNGGQLGDGTQVDRSSPVEVIGFGAAGFRAVASGR